MSWYEFLLFAHVAAAALWLGGGLFLQIYAISVQRGGDPLEMGQFAARVGRLGDRVFIPASLTVILAGVGLTIEGSWSWGTFWIVFALAAFAGSFLTGAFVIGPTAKKIGAVGADTPEGQAADAADLHRLARRPGVHVRDPLRDDGEADQRRRLGDPAGRRDPGGADGGLPRPVAPAASRGRDRLVRFQLDEERAAG